MLPFLFRFRTIRRFVARVSILRSISLIPSRLLYQAMQLSRRFQRGDSHRSSHFVRTLISNGDSRRLVFRRRFIRVTHAINIVRRISHGVRNCLILIINQGAPRAGPRHLGGKSQRLCLRYLPSIRKQRRRFLLFQHVTQASS